MRDMAEEIYDNMRHYPPSNRIWERWKSVNSRRGKPEGMSFRDHTINQIEELLDAGYEVKYGWCGSSMVRTFKEYWIFYKEKKKRA